MKILLMTDRLETGGAETHIAALARGLRARGERVEVQSWGGRTAEELASEGVRQHILPPIGHSAVRFWRAARYTRRLILQEGYDVLHAHARIPAMLQRAATAGIRPTPRRVVTVHAAFRGGLLLSKVCYWGERTIAVSEDLRALAADRFSVPAECITVIPNGIDLDKFSPPDIPPPPQSLLFVSRLDGDCSRGAFLLCRAYPMLQSRFPGLRLTVAGGGAALSELQALVTSLGLPLLPSDAPSARAGVRLCGAVPADEMPMLYRSHRVFVGVSRAAMEAAGCGCTVLLCGNEGYGGRLVPPADLPALSNFCCRGLPSPTLPQLCADLAAILSEPSPPPFLPPPRAFVPFSVDQMVDKTLQVYRKN